MVSNNGYHKSFLPLVFLLLVIVIGSPVAIAGEPLDALSIMEALRGKTAEGSHHKRGEFIMSFDVSGAYTTKYTSGKQREGTWFIKRDGFLCIVPEHKNVTKCRKVEKDGNGGIRFINLEKQKVVAEFHKIYESNENK